MSFFLENRSKSKITLIKAKCAVIYYGNNNGNHMYCKGSHFIWVYFHEHSQFTGQQGKGEVISLTPLKHFHRLHS